MTPGTQSPLSERRQGDDGVRLAQAGMLLNMVLAIVKVLAGIIGHSYALIADGIESVADIFGSLIVWSGLRVARPLQTISEPKMSATDSMPSAIRA